MLKTTLDKKVTVNYAICTLIVRNIWLNVQKLKKEVKEIRENRSIQHDDIFSKKINKKIMAVKLFAKAFKKRKQILAQQELL